MTIYERPTKYLMADWAKETLQSEQIFSKHDAINWFSEHYPNIKSITVGLHVEVMSINNPNRRHYPSVKPGSGHDVFYKLGSDQFRLLNAGFDGPPLYKWNIEKRILHPIRVDTGNPNQAAALLPKSARSTSNLDLTHALVLVSCVKSKLSHPAPARSLYTSAWFQKARDIVEGSGAHWFILSSRYGLVAPDAEIAPYDYTLNTLGEDERRAWAADVLEALLPLLGNERRVVMIAGYRYREFLVEPLEQRGIEVEVPMAHHRRGEQLAWLSNFQ